MGGGLIQSGAYDNGVPVDFMTFGGRRRRVQRPHYRTSTLGNKFTAGRGRVPNFSRTYKLWRQDFQSSTGRTPQYLQFHRTFKRELLAFLAPYTRRVYISSPNHFDFSGFFETNSGKIYYVHLEDLRWSKDDLLIREAKDFRDYTGGMNEYIDMTTLESGLMRYLR